MSDYEKLSKLRTQANELLNTDNITYSSGELRGWQKSVKRFLSKYYGNNSDELIDFEELDFGRGVGFEYDRIDACKDDLIVAKMDFDDYLEDMESNNGKLIKGKIVPDIKNIENVMTSERKDFNRIFIVHGHDMVLKLEVARLLERQNIEAIILHEQTSDGMSALLEKIEKYSDVGAAIVLFTPDDEGRAKDNKTSNCIELRNRARQNVVFEAGYFAGHLGRNRVIPIVTDENIELPGDLSGIVYSKENWQFKLIQELGKMGFNVDANKIIM